MSGYNPLSMASPEYSRLPPRSSRGGFHSYPSRPEMASDHLLKNLVRVR